MQQVKHRGAEESSLECSRSVGRESMAACDDPTALKALSRSLFCQPKHKAEHNSLGRLLARQAKEAAGQARAQGVLLAGKGLSDNSQQPQAGTTQGTAEQQHVGCPGLSLPRPTLKFHLASWARTFLRARWWV